MRKKRMKERSEKGERVRAEKVRERAIERRE